MFKKQLPVKIEALAVIIGTIIGAGVFTLPYVAYHSGLFITAIWLGVVLFFIIYLHLAFGEIIFRTEKDFRLPGYAGYYLGAPAKKFMLMVTFLTFSFSLLIYLLLGGQFLRIMFSSFLPSQILPLSFCIILFWLCLNLVILSKKGAVSKVNLILSFALLFLFVCIALYSLPNFNLSNINIFRLSSKWAWIIPYGVLFYALNGMIAVPEAARILQKRKVPKIALRKIVIFGILIPALCYLGFMIIVTGVSGNLTSMEAIAGLKSILGKGIIFLGALLGFLAVTTSYLIFALYIKHCFIKDFHWSSFVSNFVVILGPLALYLMNFANVIKLISFMGGMLGGFEGVMILLILQKAKTKSALTPAYEIPLNRFVFTILIVALVVGALIQTFLVY